MRKGNLLRGGGAILAALIVTGLSAFSYGRAHAADRTPILAKPQQKEREEIALRLYASAPFQQELTRAKALFAASPLANTDDARSTIERTSEAMAYQAALYAANFDTRRPFILWGTNAAHTWMGIDVPSSGYALDSPDNIYRHATLDGAAQYRIRGTQIGNGPSQQTYVIYRSIPGVTETMNAEGHMDEIGGIKSEDLVRDKDGGFTITIDAQPANGRANHLQVPGDLDSLHLMIRDSLADWTNELPFELSIERIDAPADTAPRDEAQMAQHAAQILASYIPYWLAWFESYVYAKPLNEVVQPWKRVQGWGMTQQGRFAFGEDEAWVLTLDPLDAKFFDIQISDPWTKAAEYVSRTGSFNASQAHRNADGTLTLVVAPGDPGVYNWLDTSGLTSGTFQVRWQSLPTGVSGEGAVRDAKVVKLSELRSLLPLGTRFVTAKQRAKQIKQRAASYANRLR